jgi:large subunit ribosomal protein L17
MFRNMVTSLFKHDRIRTTDAKAKELRRWADHVVTLAKRGDLHARRQVLAILREKQVVHKLFEEVQDRFGSVRGGYTRVVKVGHRAGDAAPLSLVELVTAEPPKKKAKKKPAPAAAEAVAAPAAAAASTEADAAAPAEPTDEAAPAATEERADDPPAAPADGESTPESSEPGDTGGKTP